MTFADLMAMKRVSDPQISPSGKWVMFTVMDVSLEKNTKTNHLWVVPLAGGAERQVTMGAGESNGRFSPDGKSVLYTSVEGGGQLWLAAWDDAAGTMSADQMLPSIPSGADGAIWAPDSNHFLFTASVYPDCESHAADLHKRVHEEAVCNFQRGQQAQKSPVKAQVWDDLLYRHWNAYAEGRHSHIFYGSVQDALSQGDPVGLEPVDLTPASVVGDHEAPTSFPTGGPLGYAISPDGKEIAYVVNLDKVPAESTNNDIFVLQVGAPPQTAKKVSTSPGSDDGPQYSPDGKWLAWRSQARAGFESDKFDLVVMDRATGKINDITTKFFAWVDEFEWSNDGRLFVVSGSRGGTSTQTISVDGKWGDTFNPVDMSPRGEYSDIRPLVDGQSIIAVRMAADSPAAIVRVSNTEESGTNAKGFFHILGTSFKPLTHSNEVLVSQLDFSPLESFWFPGANGTKVEGFLVKPPNFDPAKKYPLKFLIHGGPQGAWGDAWSYRWNPELFAANGYVVVMINPRGSTGYGQQFVDEVSGDWGGRPYIDLMKGLDYAEAKFPFIDKTRECALGASYGGYMANWILTHTDRFQCIVTHDGAYNLQSMFGTTEELWFAEWEFRPLAGTGPNAVVEQTKPAHPWDFAELPAEQDPFRKWSPRMYIDQAKTPTLVIHSQRDYRLDLSEGLQLFTALQLRGVPSRFLYFPDEGHWVLKPQNSQLWYQTVNDWVDRWTHTNAYDTSK
jgi:dipeptidyl aminopeptidase/acylaminoacyl peptidase